MALLSRFGIGAATIDLIPDETRVQPGGEVAAHLELEGGVETQTIDDIEIALVTSFMAHRVDDSYPTHYVLWETEFRDGLTVEAGVDRTLDVPPIQVPRATPVTMGEVEVWIQTGLDIEWAIDPSDEDQLDVVPGPQLRGVLEAMGELGFTLQSVSNEETETSHTSAPFVQRFAYESTDGADTSVVLTPILPTDGGNLIVRHTRPGQEERAGQVVIDSDDVEAITEQLRILLQNESA